MGSNSTGEFGVVVKRKEVIAAALPVQEHWLPMSNLDLLLPPLEVAVFFCYDMKHEHGHETSSILISKLKKSLAQALVSFYAFAGEVMQNGLGEPELLCNNRGVDFIHAYALVDLQDLDLHRPDTSIQAKLVPFNNQGVLSIQVTELKCGGLVIGCTFDHRVADAHSANMFFVAWANMALPKPIPHAHAPSFRRSLLSPRRPPNYDHSSVFDNMYVFISMLSAPPKDEEEEEEDRLLSRIYYIEAEEINRLQSLASANNNGKRRSKLESFSAFLWKLIAAGGDDPNKRCKMGIVVDGRERLNNHSRGGGRGGGKADAFAFPMQNYFGNVLSVPYGEESVGELKEMALSEVANVLHACVEGAAKEEHFLGLIDWVELHRPQKAIVKVYCKEDDDEAAVVVSSGQRFPVSKMDFGWGQPAFASYHFPWGGQTGYVMPMPSTSKDGDWIVYMHLLKKHLDLVDSKAPHIFRPLTPTYLNLKP
ncbi:Anthranilate N-benzoyltransferase protein [Actinidia chinensis var. chinensis]|uniref:Anthranilate N-benzoyltransferase protein n=1 Tax=Actinidia chinensis var. chinensis TaxID=1590841 RepID=A0A2R6P529_ACTCC|nr:Anthranilate N-benzoyltransferase protein [Actinidia chinensis var. chinensis]